MLMLWGSVARRRQAAETRNCR